MTSKSLLLIWYVTAGIFAHSMTVQSKHIIQKRDLTPCTPQIKNNTKSFLLQLDDHYVEEFEKQERKYSWESRSEL